MKSLSLSPTTDSISPPHSRPRVGLPLSLSEVLGVALGGLLPSPPLLKEEGFSAEGAPHPFSSEEDLRAVLFYEDLHSICCGSHEELLDTMLLRAMAMNHQTGRYVALLVRSEQTAEELICKLQESVPRAVIHTTFSKLSQRLLGSEYYSPSPFGSIHFIISSYRDFLKLLLREELPLEKPGHVVFESPLRVKNCIIDPPLFDQLLIALDGGKKRKIGYTCIHSGSLWLPKKALQTIFGVPAEQENERAASKAAPETCSIIFTKSRASGQFLFQSEELGRQLLQRKEKGFLAFFEQMTNYFSIEELQFTREQLLRLLLALHYKRHRSFKELLAAFEQTVTYRLYSWVAREACRSQQQQQGGKDRSAEEEGYAIKKGEKVFFRKKFTHRASDGSLPVIPGQTIDFDLQVLVVHERFIKRRQELIRMLRQLTNQTQAQETAGPSCVLPLLEKKKDNLYYITAAGRSFYQLAVSQAEFVADDWLGFQQTIEELLREEAIHERREGEGAGLSAKTLVEFLKKFTKLNFPFEFFWNLKRERAGERLDEIAQRALEFNKNWLKGYRLSSRHTVFAVTSCLRFLQEATKAGVLPVVEEGEEVLEAFKGFLKEECQIGFYREREAAKKLAQNNDRSIAGRQVVFNREGLIRAIFYAGLKEVLSTTEVTERFNVSYSQARSALESLARNKSSKKEKKNNRQPQTDTRKKEKQQPSRRMFLEKRTVRQGNRQKSYYGSKKAFQKAGFPKKKVVRRRGATRATASKGSFVGKKCGSCVHSSRMGTCKYWRIKLHEAPSTIPKQYLSRCGKISKKDDACTKWTSAAKRQREQRARLTGEGGGGENAPLVGRKEHVYTLSLVQLGNLCRRVEGKGLSQTISYVCPSCQQPLPALGTGVLPNPATRRIRCSFCGSRILVLANQPRNADGSLASEAKIKLALGELDLLRMQFYRDDKRIPPSLQVSQTSRTVTIYAWDEVYLEQKEAGGLITDEDRHSSTNSSGPITASYALFVRGQRYDLEKLSFVSFVGGGGKKTFKELRKKLRELGVQVRTTSLKRRKEQLLEDFLLEQAEGTMLLSPGDEEVAAAVRGIAISGELTNELLLARNLSDLCTIAHMDDHQKRTKEELSLETSGNAADASYSYEFWKATDNLIHSTSGVTNIPLARNLEARTKKRCYEKLSELAEAKGVISFSRGVSRRVLHKELLSGDVTRAGSPRDALENQLFVFLKELVKLLHQQGGLPYNLCQGVLHARQTKSQLDQKGLFFDQVEPVRSAAQDWLAFAIATGYLSTEDCQRLIGADGTESYTVKKESYPKVRQLAKQVLQTSISCKEGEMPLYKAYLEQQVRGMKRLLVLCLKGFRKTMLYQEGKRKVSLLDALKNWDKLSKKARNNQTMLELVRGIVREAKEKSGYTPLIYCPVEKEPLLEQLQAFAKQASSFVEGYEASVLRKQGATKSLRARLMATGWLLPDERLRYKLTLHQRRKLQHSQALAILLVRSDAQVGFINWYRVDRLIRLLPFKRSRTINLLEWMAKEGYLQKKVEKHRRYFRLNGERAEVQLLFLIAGFTLKQVGVISGRPPPEIEYLVEPLSPYEGERANERHDTYNRHVRQPINVPALYSGAAIKEARAVVTTPSSEKRVAEQVVPQQAPPTRTSTLNRVLALKRKELPSLMELDAFPRFKAELAVLLTRAQDLLRENNKPLKSPFLAINQEFALTPFEEKPRQRLIRRIRQLQFNAQLQEEVLLGGILKRNIQVFLEDFFSGETAFSAPGESLPERLEETFEWFELAVRRGTDYGREVGL